MKTWHLLYLLLPSLILLKYDNIPSQVSSYLDRNGIWQGKSQELYNEATAELPGTVWAYDYNNTFFGLENQALQQSEGVYIYATDSQRDNPESNNLLHKANNTYARTNRGTPKLIRFGYSKSETSDYDARVLASRANKTGLCVVDLTYCLWARESTNNWGPISTTRNFNTYSSDMKNFPYFQFLDALKSNSNEKLKNYHFKSNSLGWQNPYVTRGWVTNTGMSDWTCPGFSTSFEFQADNECKVTEEMFTWTAPNPDANYLQYSGGDENQSGWIIPWAKDPTQKLFMFFVKKDQTIRIKYCLNFFGRAINDYGLYTGSDSVEKSCHCIGFQINKMEIY